jgi:hypothetical protein
MRVLFVEYPSQLLADGVLQLGSEIGSGDGIDHRTV